MTKKTESLYVTKPVMKATHSIPNFPSATHYNTPRMVTWHDLLGLWGVRLMNSPCRVDPTLSSWSVSLGSEMLALRTLTFPCRSRNTIRSHQCLHISLSELSNVLQGGQRDNRSDTDNKIPSRRWKWIKSDENGWKLTISSNHNIKAQLSNMLSIYLSTTSTDINWIHKKKMVIHQCTSHPLSVLKIPT